MPKGFPRLATADETCIHSLYCADGPGFVRRSASGGAEKLIRACGRKAVTALGESLKLEGKWWLALLARTG